MRRRLLTLLILASVSGAVAGAVGNATAGKGPGRVARPAAPATGTTFYPGACPVPAALRPAFVRAARETKLPLSMLVAVAQVESNLEADARSSAGARGLLQVMPGTAASLNLNVDEPAANVLAGARYLRQQLDRFRSTDLALAAYNAGPTAIAAAGGQASEATFAYVANVTALWRSLARCH